MSNQTQEQIDALIQFINDTEVAESVTNVIVAAVLAFLSYKVKTMATAEALSDEASARQDADAALESLIQAEAAARQSEDSVLSTRITTLQRMLESPMNGGTNDTVKNNVDLLQAKIDELIRSLADLAFNGTLPNNRPELVGSLNWETTTPDLTSPASGTTINIGTHNGNGISKTIPVQGRNLTQPLTVAVSGNGFLVSPAQISAATANAGTSIAVTYNGSDSSASGALTISSSEVTRVIALTARYQAAGTETVHTVTIDRSLSQMTHCSAEFASGDGTRISDGGEVSINIIPGEGYTLVGQTANVQVVRVGTQTPALITPATAQNDRIVVTISDIYEDVTVVITAEAIATGQQSGYALPEYLVFHLDSDDFQDGDTTWTDKIGSRVFTMTDVTKTSAGVVFNGTTSQGIAALDNSLPLYNEGTIEVVLKSLSCNNRACVFQAKKTHGIALTQWMPGKKYWEMMSGASVSTKVEHNVLDTELSVGNAFSGYVGMNQDVARVNTDSYEAVNEESTFRTGEENYWPLYGNDELRLGKLITQATTYTAMTLCAVRIYSTKLTASQMLKNLKEDNRRYSLGLTLPESSD